MKQIRFYNITAEMLDNEEYRPAEVETDCLTTEDEWTVEDVITNNTDIIEDYEGIELVAECGDINVYKVYQTDWEADEPRYFGVVEIVDDAAFYMARH